MFEKCGLRDVFYRIWMYKFWILGVITIFFLLGFFLFPTNNEDEPMSHLVDANGHWAASASYLVSSESGLSDEAGENETDSTDLKLAHTYAEILHADFSAEKLLTQLRQKYSMDELINNLSWDVTEETVSPFAFRNTYFADVLEPAPIVNIYVYSKDEALARDFLAECIAVFESTVDVVPNSSISKLDGVVAYEYLEDSAPVSESNVGLKNSLVLLPILGCVVSLLVVCALAIFRPTINRKGDFSLYDIFVIGEVSLPRGRTGVKDEK